MAVRRPGGCALGGSGYTSCIGKPNRPLPRASLKELAMSKKQRANSAYIFNVEDGKMVWTYPGIGRIEFDPNKASATNRARAMAYGWKQRINDAAALDAGPDGRVDAQAKFDEQKRLVEYYESGAEEWALKSTGIGAGATAYVTQALVAIGQYQGFDVSTTELANAFVKRLAEAPKLKLGGEIGKARKWLEANSKIVREKIAELKAQETPQVDADKEIEELMQN